MSRVKFFSNNLIRLGGKECEIVSSLNGERGETWVVKFEVPEHTTGTTNLVVFLDGKIQIPNRDYIDVNSFEVEFSNPVSPNSDFHAILIKTGMDGTVEDVVWEDF